MSYTIANVNGCTKKLQFSFENLDLTNEIESALTQKRKEVSIKGFRKGKAPADMVKKIYGHQIESDAVNRFVQSKLYDAIEGEKLKVIGYPSFENMEYKPGSKISFDAVVEIFPEITLKDFSKYSFKKDKVEVSEEDVQNMIKRYTSSKAEMKAIEDGSVKLEKGHFAVMNFQGIKEDGEKPENMKGEEFMLEIGSGQFIPGFEDGMIGMKKGEKRDVHVTFPANYQASELQNAKVTFAVELLEIKSKILPDLTDELCKELGFESKNDFMSKNQENILQQKERQTKEKLHQEILDKLISENSFDVPNTLLAQQEKHVKEEMAQNLKYQGFNDQMVEQYFVRWKDDLVKKAEFQVKSGLILDKIARDNAVEATESDLEGKIAEIAKGANIDPEQVKKYYTTSPKIKSNLMYAIREEKTFEKLTQMVKIN